MTIRDVALSDVVAALERAARCRREMAIAAGAPPGNIRERIDAIPHGTLRPVGTDGWLVIGIIHDATVSQQLQVHWHPASDRVKVQRPSDPNCTSTPAPVGRPGLTVSLGVRREYRADPNYRYVLDSQEYTPAEAERIAAQRDSIAGWTWRRRDAVPSSL